MRTLLVCLLTTVLVSAQPAPATDVTRVRDVIYQKRDGFTLTLDVFKPAKPNGAAIIKIISGGWNSNHNGIGDGGWTKAGYTTFVVVHGSQPRFHIDEIVTDVQRAVRFVRASAATYGIDPDKIGVTGGSAGGHLSLMLAVKGDAGNAKATDPVDRTSSAVNAVACFYPPTDFISWIDENDGLNGVGPLATRKPAFGPKIETPEGMLAMGKALSPINFIAKTQPPIYIVQGDNDALVHYSQALRFQSKSAAAGATCEVLIREGAGHGGWKEMGEDNARMAEWFDLHLLGKQPKKPFTNGVSKLPSTTPGKK
ncbi:acetylxylan esterase [Opitutia bacterium]|jgi:acetyl esterase/lipase|nr:acetylxylan esterase [Opitutae bacterium]